MRRRYLFLGASLILLLIACNKDSTTETPTPNVSPETPTLDTIPPTGTSRISASPQRIGDANKGWEYLITGDYVNSGPPLDLATTFFGESDNLLDREGDNANLPYQFNAVTAANGVKVAAPTCLTCHAEFLNGQLVPGLGDNTVDYSQDQGGQTQLLTTAIHTFYGANSPEAVAYEPFRRATEVISEQTITAVRGVNPAGKLAVVLDAHRNSSDLTWSTNPLYPIPQEVIPSDVPAWWLTKKKNALYYAGIGRGDHAKTIMAASVLTLQDAEQAAEIDSHFPDVLAYLKSIEPPDYPEMIDATKIANGKEVFNIHCAKCHGTYGANETYPNLLVDLDNIQTDPLLAVSNYGLGQFVDSYNNSWFGQGENAARLVPSNGYVAPPLDGVWATAPYLHNGSIPTLEDLLNSEQRPTYWERSFESDDFDYQKVGWHYENRTAGGDPNIYDTTLPGYGNDGHFYGDKLDAADRSDLIEYLKTL